MSIHVVHIPVVKFSLIKDEGRYKAEFIRDGERTDWKYLTPVEQEGLQELLTENEVTVDALGLYEELADLWFDTASGEPTNFEEMLYEFLGDEIDE